MAQWLSLLSSHQGSLRSKRFRGVLRSRPISRASKNTKIAFLVRKRLLRRLHEGFSYQSEIKLELRKVFQINTT